MKKITFILLSVALLSIVGMRMPKDGGYQVGDIVKDFKLMNIDEREVSLLGDSDVLGTILIFTCNTCPYAVLYEDRIIDLHQKYASRGYPVVAINPNDKKQKPGDSFAMMQQRAKEKTFPFPYLYDESQEITTLFGATKTPHVFILKKIEGQMRVTYIGAIDDNHKEPESVTKKYVEQALDEILSGKEVTTSNTKAIGCTIKWKSN